MLGTIPECLHDRRAVYPIPLRAHFRYSIVSVRIGLFTEQDSGGPRQPCGNGRCARRTPPARRSIIEHYSTPAVSRRLCVRTRAGEARRGRSHRRRSRGDDCGPFAMIALLVAWRFSLPVIGSFQPSTSRNERAVSMPTCGASFVRPAGVLVTSLAARDDVDRRGHQRVENRRLASWRRCVDVRAIEAIQRASRALGCFGRASGGYLCGRHCQAIAERVVCCRWKLRCAARVPCTS